MAKAEVFIFEIPNWEEWQERTNRKNYSWFKFHTDFFFDAKICEASDRAKLLFIYALCARNKKISELCEVNVKVACSFLQWTHEELSSAYNEIATLGLILPHKTGKTRRQPVLRRPRLDKIRGEERREEEKRGEPRETAPPLHPLAELWNQNRGSLPGVQACKHQRLKHADARWTEKPDSKYWKSVLERIQASEFCKGKNDRGWKADFDWLIKPETATKVLEGKYDGRQSATQQAHDPDFEAELAQLRDQQRQAMEGSL